MRARWPARTMAALTFLAAPGLAAAQTHAVKAGGTDDCPTVPASVGCENIFPGGSLQLPLAVEAFSPSTLDDLSVRLTWDAGLLTYQSAADGPVGVVTVDDADAGTGSLDVSVTAADSDTSWVMAQLTFTAGSSSGWNTLSAQVLSAVDGEGGDATFNVSGDPSAVCIGLRGVLGDATDDGGVDIIDAQQIARWALALEVLPETQRALDEGLGDNTEDGSTDVIDAQQIARHVVGLSTTGAIGDPKAGCRGPLPDVETETLALFAEAFGGGFGDNLVLHSGLLTDEFIHSGTFTTRRAIDRREVASDNGQLQQVYEALNQARQRASEEAETLTQLSWDPALDERIPLFHGLAGYSYVFLAEQWCSGASFTDLDELGGVVTARPPLTTAEMLDTAVARFDVGLNYDPADSIANMLRVGKARAQLGQGDLAGAASTANAVPTGYSFLVDYTADAPNAVFDYQVGSERYSLADGEGGSGILFRTAADARVPFQQDPGDGLGFDLVTPQFNLLKYPASTASIRLATGEEARYIEAEQLLDTDQDGAVSLLNEVRSIYGLGSLIPSLPLPDDEIAALLFEERALTLAATAHRLGDLRRMVVQHGFVADSVFPVGTYHKAFPDYQSDVNFPVPDTEVTRNPLTSGCFDRNP